jgi:hypothetical protein
VSSGSNSRLRTTLAARLSKSKNYGTNLEDKFLIFFTIIGLLSLAFSIYLIGSNSISAIHSRESFSVSRIAITPDPLNYTAYVIQKPAVAEITLSYSFPRQSGSGVLNLTSVLSVVNSTGSAIVVTPCGSSEVGGGVACNIVVNPDVSEITYHPDLTTTVAFIISVNASSLTGEYFLFPLGGSCGSTVFIIVGDKIPVRALNGCPPADSLQSVNMTVVGIDNMTGLDLPF